MSDIERRMAEWRKTVWGAGPCPDLSQENFRLTDAEREALEQCAKDYKDSAALCRERGWDGEAVKRMKRAMVLRGLLERMG